MNYEPRFLGVLPIHAEKLQIFRISERISARRTDQAGPGLVPAVRQRPEIRRDIGFILPIHSTANGDASILEKKLGLEAGALKGEISVIEIPFDFKYSPKLPSGFETSADPNLFRFGGITSGGAPELVFKELPVSEVIIRKLGEFK